jgi:sulfur carrier protein
MLNGIEQAHRPGVSLRILVEEVIAAPRGVAVAVNREVVPRSAWETTYPEAGDQIEVVAAAAGG